MTALKIDEEFKNLIPPLSPEEFKQLEENIISDGCRDSLVVWNGYIVDGHNRYKICTEHSIPFQTVDKRFTDRDDVIQWIILNQFGRRNLSPGTRGILALRLEPILAEKAKERQVATQLVGKGIQNKDMVVPKSAQPSEQGKTRDELAKIAGVGHDTIDKVKKIVESGDTGKIERIKKGDKGNTVNAVYSELRAETEPPKICTVCGKEKSAAEFYGGRNTCKNCYNAQAPNETPKLVPAPQQQKENHPPMTVKEIYAEMKDTSLP